MQGRTMLDRWSLHLLAPPMAAAARSLVRAGLGADAITLRRLRHRRGRCGGHCDAGTRLGLALLLASRLCDGLDGAVARLTRRPTAAPSSTSRSTSSSTPACRWPLPWPTRRQCAGGGGAAGRLHRHRSAASWPLPCWPRSAAEERRPTRQGPVLPGRPDRGHRDPGLLCADVPVAPSALRSGPPCFAGAVCADDRHPPGGRMEGVAMTTVAACCCCWPWWPAWCCSSPSTCSAS
jgi:hypothetical protein